MSGGNSECGCQNDGDVDIIRQFRRLVWEQNMAVPVAAMSALVLKIKAGLYLCAFNT